MNEIAHYGHEIGHQQIARVITYNYQTPQEFIRCVQRNYKRDEGLDILLSPSVKIQNLLTGVHTSSFGTNWENFLKMAISIW